jgi:putative transposase
MKTSRLTDEKIIGFLTQVEAGAAVKELGRKQELSDAFFYKWRSRFGGTSASDARRLRELEGERRKVRQLLAETMLDIEPIEAIAREKREAPTRVAKRCRRCGRRPACRSVGRAG